MLPSDPDSDKTNALEIAAFCPSHLWDAAKKAGATRVGDSTNLLPLILDPINGLVPDRVVATNDQMGTLARLARILGPKGLMPTIRSGTLVPPAEAQLTRAIIDAKQSTPFRVERESAKFAMVVSRCGWSVSAIKENVSTVMGWLQKQRRTTEAGRFIENASMVIGYELKESSVNGEAEVILPIAESEYAASTGPRFVDALEKLRETVSRRRATYVHRI